jgi:hypothetical protein
MISRELQQAVAPRARTLNVLWGAFLAATVIYVGVVMLALAGTTPATPAEPAAGTPPDPRLVTAVLAAMAVAVAAGSFFAPRLLLSGRKGLSPAISGAGSAPTAAETAAASRLPESERTLLGHLPAYQTTLIVVWAMREAIAVFGVIAAILTRQPTVVVPFAVAALALLALARPRVTAFLDGAGRSA